MFDTAKTGVIEAADLDEYRDAVDQWQVDFDQLSAGSFTPCLKYAQAGSLLFYRVHWNQRLHVNGATPAGHIMVGIPASRQTHIIMDGVPLDDGFFAVKPAAADIDFSTAAISDHIILLIPPELLERHLGEESAAALKDGHNSIHYNPVCTIELARTISRMLAGCARHNEMLDDEQTCNAIQSELLDILAQHQSPMPDRPNRANRPKRRRALKKALEYINELPHTIAIPQLAAKTGVSQRTLEYAFVENYGVSPIRFLRLQRLNRLRRALADAEPGTTTITEAATEYGFSELGRMASEFQQMFGQTPSSTLAETKFANSARLTKMRY